MTGHIYGIHIYKKKKKLKYKIKNKMGMVDIYVASHIQYVSVSGGARIPLLGGKLVF